MAFKMIYDERNRKNLNQLADTTKAKAYQWYQFCFDNKIQVLVYETIRTKAQQAEYVKNGKSKTMNSWHLTGQALDWVLVDVNGKALWGSYKTANGLKVINYAKSIGFTSGHDWGWDSPHLQYDKIKYGADTFNNRGKAPATPNKESEEDMAKIAELESKVAQLEAELAKMAPLVDHTQSDDEEMKLALEWAYKNGILKGNGEGLNAGGALTREQFVTMLLRFYKALAQ